MTTPGTDHPPPVSRASRGGVLRFLPAVTLVAVLTITASAEFELARTVLDLPPSIAWALPVAVDSYVLAALRSGRDVVPALAVMAGSLAASMGAHLATAGADGRLPGHVVAPAATGIMTVLVVVAWRVHVLIEYMAEQPDPYPAVTVTAVPSTGAPEPDPAPAVTAASAPAALDAGGADRAPAGPAERPAVDGLSDAKILAEIGPRPPSIRVLKRRYAIGQTRATRLHRAAIQSSHENSPQSSIHEVSEQPHQQSHDSDHEEPIQESARPDTANTHTCITDRVGPASPPGEAAAGVAKMLDGALFGGGDAR